MSAYYAIKLLKICTMSAISCISITKASVFVLLRNKKRETVPDAPCLNDIYLSVSKQDM